MWKGFGIGMANKETIKKLDPLVRELICLFSEYFIINNVYGDDQRLKRIEVKEVFKSDEFVKYDYESIYKNIDDVVDKIKGIDTKERI